MPRSLSATLTLLLFVLSLSACGGNDTPAAAPTSRLLPKSFSVGIAAAAPEAVQWAAKDVASYLTQMGLPAAVDNVADVSCQAGKGRVVFVGDGLGTPEFKAESTNQTWRIRETLCAKNGVLVELMGGGLLGRQYAGYDLLHRIGVRFFHPEQEFVPDVPDWPLAAMDIEHTPPFKLRSVSLHLTHPLELGDAFRLGKAETMPEAKRYIDWTIKNYASDGLGGAGSGELADYGMKHGFPTSAGFSLYNQQQGGNGILDVGETNWQPKLEAAIVKAMGTDPENYPAYFGFTFNPTEFTEAPDKDVVEQLTFIGNYFAEHYPKTTILTINHGTYGKPTPFYGVRYFDLPKFAPANIGVKVHTLMFYDLFRPAPVYGNQNFNFLYDFMAAEYTKRPLVYFPEAAWWLTFDIAVPLYLPITIEARGRDIDGISYMLKGKLFGHHTFGSGHEWGYWQNEYCSLRMANDLSFSWRDCLADIVYPMGEAGPEVQSVLERAIAIEERDIIYGNILRYLVGSDPETEAASSVGIDFHPLPPAPSEIAAWDEASCRDFEGRISAQLSRFDDDLMALVVRLNAVAETVPPKAKPFFEEIRDGLEATAIRARHQRLAYGSLVSARLGKLSFSEDLAKQATQRLTDAKAVTQAALAIVAKREAGYRYKPLDRAIAGGPASNQDSNWTVYKYRYLNRTHHAYYYTRIDTLVEDALAGGSEAVEIRDALLAPEEDLSLTITDTTLSDISVDLGDGSRSSETSVTHDYAQSGTYKVQVTAKKDGETYSYVGNVAKLDSEFHTGFSGKVIEPKGASIIAPVFPALVLGRIGSSQLIIGFSAAKDGRVWPANWASLQAKDSTAFYENEPKDLIVPIVDKKKETVTATLKVSQAKILWNKQEETLDMTGDLDTEAIIQAVVLVGGFDEKGARSMVASILGYKPDTLPKTVPMDVQYTPEVATPAAR